MAEGVDRSTMIVAASRGVAGVTRPAARSASRVASFSLNQSSCIRTDTRLSSGDFCDQLYLDRRVEGEHRHPDSAAGVPSGVAEHFDQQLARAVGHLGLGGE